MEGETPSLQRAPHARVRVDEAIRREFAERGIVRIEGLVPQSSVTRNRERVYGILEAAGAWQDGRWAFTNEPTEQQSLGKFDWIAPTKALPMRQIRNCAKSKTFQAMFAPDALAAARELGGERLFASEPEAGGAQALTRPQLLFTPPGARHWFVPNAMWHVDAPRLGEAGPPGLQIFILLDEIPPGGGATLVVAGSHRLLNDRVRRSKDIKKSLKRRPYFQFLMGPRPQAQQPSETDQTNADSTRLLHQPGQDGDVPLQVVELAGQAGDAYITDLRLLHTPAPNASSRPRLMATQRLPYLDMVDNLDDAYAQTRHHRSKPTAT